MKAYFDPNEPYYLTREPTFDGRPIDVPEEVLATLESRKATLKQMEEEIDAVALDDAAQTVTDTFIALLRGEKTLG